jgi:TRAP-type C4-dicarboxylate transport system permease small subunit
MKPDAGSTLGSPRPLGSYHQVLRKLTLLLAYLAGAGLMVMMVVTSLDVILRVFRISVTGAYDIVRIAGTITIAAALPYTTAIKGHVAIEFFFHQLGRRGRIAVDTLMRLIDMTLFSALAWFAVRYGNSLKQSGEVSMTLQLPVFWVPYVLAGSCVLVVLITLYHLLYPGKEMIKP